MANCYRRAEALGTRRFDAVCLGARDTFVNSMASPYVPSHSTKFISKHEHRECYKPSTRCSKQIELAHEAHTWAFCGAEMQRCTDASVTTSVADADSDLCIAYVVPCCWQRSVTATRSMQHAVRQHRSLDIGYGAAVAVLLAMRC